MSISMKVIAAHAISDLAQSFSLAHRLAPYPQGIIWVFCHARVGDFGCLGSLRECILCILGDDTFIVQQQDNSEGVGRLT